MSEASRDDCYVIAVGRAPRPRVWVVNTATGSMTNICATEGWQPADINAARAFGEKWARINGFRYFHRCPVCGELPRVRCTHHGLIDVLTKGGRKPYIDATALGPM